MTPAHREAESARLLRAQPLRRLSVGGRFLPPLAQPLKVGLLLGLLGRLRFVHFAHALALCRRHGCWVVFLLLVLDVAIFGDCVADLATPVQSFAYKSRVF